MSFAELAFETQLKQMGISGFVREYRFHPTRKWRFDFAAPDEKIAIEIEGGIHSKGRHVRPKGYIGDLEKYNEAAWLGWRVLRYSTSQVNGGIAILDLYKKLTVEKEKDGKY